jgi:hypothetical protein
MPAGMGFWDVVQPPAAAHGQADGGDPVVREQRLGGGVRRGQLLRVQAHEFRCDRDVGLRGGVTGGAPRRAVYATARVAVPDA